jgi:DUF4097 and DUF4098 domain-containing protein YvlB
LVNVNGSVTIEGWDKDQVEVHAVKTATRDSQDLRRVRIDVQAQPGAVRIRTRYPENDPAGVNVEYRLRVPFRAALHGIETVNGHVRIRRMESAGALRTVNGDVGISDSAGRFDARTTNGEVHAELLELSPVGGMTLEAVNGAVVLVLPPEAGAVLEVRSMNGEFTSEFPVAVQGAFGREFRGRIGRGGVTVRLRSVNGSIAVLALRPTV